MAGGVFMTVALRAEPVPEPVLSDVERRVLAALRRSEDAGERIKARELAVETAVELPELERICDDLLAKGFIGPWPKRA